MIIVLFLIALVFLVLNIKNNGFMKNRFTFILAVLSVAWWIFMIIGQLRITLNCTPDDGFCNSGNTFLGDLIWGSMLALYSLFFIWAPFTVIAYFVTKRNNSKS